ncbi:hypothetical protein Tsubulata_004710 [Turnera subulata]|uniref:CCHC-type domain-containing protein n=1 Tax=Turnera subulata TaxID=218843 RepID=A0A9Q0JDL5_9ROSI|nr:hypothetical protein Tsubulata_004710 [Turnera subulata]
MESINGGNGSLAQYGMEKLVGTNYKYCRMCMEAYLQELDPYEKISEARQRRFLIRGLRKKYTLFATSIQGWANRPTIEELESLVANQVALARQMAKNFTPDAPLFSKGKQNKNYSTGGSKDAAKSSNAERNTGGNFQNKQPIKCYRCDKLGHYKKNCRVKIAKANIACTSKGGDEPKWEQCFTIKAIEQNSTHAFVSYASNAKKEEWIMDSGCSHHVTGDDSSFSEIREPVEIELLSL